MSWEGETRRIVDRIANLWHPLDARSAGIIRRYFITGVLDRIAAHSSRPMASTGHSSRADRQADSSSDPSGWRAT
jgi:hypothetical protein